MDIVLIIVVSSVTAYLVTLLQLARLEDGIKASKECYHKETYRKVETYNKLTFTYDICKKCGYQKLVGYSSEVHNMRYNSMKNKR